MERLPVFVRLRPTEEEHLVKPERDGLSIQDEFYFDSSTVLVNSSQESTFQNIGVPLVCATLKGVSSTLLTYGGLGSGKTYSLFGGDKDHEKGIILRALELLIEQRGSCELNVSFYEVTSQDQLFDLLEAKQTGEVGVGGNLRGVSIVELESAEQAARLVKMAKLNRSDPSHQITSVEVIHRDVAAGAVIRSRLYLVDLASSCSNSGISRQLSLLESVIVSLGCPRVSHVPFRQCRLTHALQLALCQRSNVALLCTVRPQKGFLSETRASLRFASRAAKVPITKNFVNSEPDPYLQAIELKREVDALRRDLSIQSILSSGKHAIGTEPLTSTQLAEVHRQVEDYILVGSQPDIVSNRQLQAVFAAFKNILTKTTNNSETENGKSDLMGKVGKKTVNSAKSTGRGGPAKGVEEKNSKKSEPENNRTASRKQKDENEKKNKNNEKNKELERKSSKQSNNTPIQSESVIMDMTEKNNETNENEQLDEPPDRETSFRMFREGEGRELVRLLREAEKEAAERETTAQQEATNCNAKLELRNKLKNNNFGFQLPDGRYVISEDELEEIKEMKRLKKEISKLRQNYEIEKAQAEYCREQAAKTAERVMLEFDQWEQRNFQIGTRINSQNNINT
jgi:kinesin family protein 6/9